MPDWLHISLFGLTVFVMLFGLLGLVIPLFSGILVIWLAALGYGLVGGFGVLGGVIFAILTVLMLAGVAIDNVLMGVKANQEGASWAALFIGLGAGIAGTLFFPPLGGVVTAPLAILLYERQRVGDWQKAFAALRGLAVGFGVSYFVRLGIGLVMVLLWAIWAINRVP